MEPPETAAAASDGLKRTGTASEPLEEPARLAAAASTAASAAESSAAAAAAATAADCPDDRQPSRTTFRRLAHVPAVHGLAADAAAGDLAWGGLTLLLCGLHTGRRHQIRRHLAKNGTPIAGDVEYGRGRINRPLRELHGLSRPFLHALSVSFDHPLDQSAAAAAASSRVSCVAPLPVELVRFITAAAPGLQSALEALPGAIAS
eukprot:SAG22_NODE_1707_length_3769_cov_3.054768_3_plen_204_part_00